MGIKYEDWLNKKLKDPKFKAEYDALKSKPSPPLDRIADALERIAISIELLELFANLNKEDDDA